MRKSQQPRPDEPAAPRLPAAAPRSALDAHAAASGNAAFGAMLSRQPATFRPVLPLGVGAPTLARKPSHNAGKPSAAERLTALERRTQAVESKSTALTALFGFQSDVMARAEGWERAALRVGSAYRTAAIRYQDALGSDARDEATQLMIFGSVLTVLTVGSLAWLGAAAQAGEPLLEAGTRRAAGAGLDLPAPDRMGGRGVDLAGFRPAPGARRPGLPGVGPGPDRMGGRGADLAGFRPAPGARRPGLPGVGPASAHAPARPAPRPSVSGHTASTPPVPLGPHVNTAGQTAVGEAYDFLPSAASSAGGAPAADPITSPNDVGDRCYLPGYEPGRPFGPLSLAPMSSPSGGASAAPVVFAPGGVNTDPQLYQNDVVGRVKAAKQHAWEYLGTLTRQLDKAGPEAWASFDAQAQKTAHAEWLASAGLLATDADLPPEEEMAREFERGIWAEHWRRQRPQASYAAMTTIYPRLGDSTKRRLKELGIAAQAGLRLTGVEWFANGHLFEDHDDDDAWALMRWASAYKPKGFGR